MKNGIERRLMRRLHGELPADGRPLERQLAEDPALRATHDRLATIWNRLEMPPPRELPKDFAIEVMEAAREMRRGELTWSLAPVWARAGSSAALVVGLILGMGLGAGSDQPAIQDGVEIYADADAVPLSLAESYWLSLEEELSLDEGGRQSIDTPVGSESDL